MVITLEEIRVTFKNVIERNRSREWAADWAKTRREAFDQNNLIFVPSSAEKSIWQAIIYLGVMDLKDSPTSYLHDELDVLAYYHSMLS